MQPTRDCGGEQALARGDLAGAEALFRKVLAGNPNSAGAHTNLGVIYMRRREWSHALAELGTASRLAPNVPGIQLNIALQGRLPDRHTGF